MRRLLFATTSAGKLRELRALVAGLPLEVVSLADVGPLPEVVEDGATFVENARKKALGYARATGLLALADDSGLCVDALGGAPGVLSARYAPGDDRARINKLLAELAGVDEAHRGAAFRCALCLAAPDGVLAEVEGECRGHILPAPVGQGGFGYDPVFYVPGLGRTMAQLSVEEKQQVSHRGMALERMRPHLERLVPPASVPLHLPGKWGM
ncbi:MAG: RdgB/HAM1 family non-canonical purine NTP pyrophosphatase [Myxococcaceae bacterium]|nr:RdgB/HAM1 family non-canonical purine NTP pyrophosphatase [Myxococcaceae bacterium]MCI0671426.1 RdgB/HAM1 family non-canonical purine NTP pyrophosphatase [Myxococcaceae bacterium]